MKPEIQVSITDNSKQVKKATDSQIKAALIAIGMTAESHAKDACPVDTGLLRNSITYALAGESPAISSYTDDPGEQHGTYSGTAPGTSGKTRAVYLGSNVEYAELVEKGTSGRTAKPFIKPAVQDHTSEYMKLLADALKSGI